MGKEIALITGSSRGIGAACATEFAQTGYNVIIHCNNNVERAKDVANAYVSLGAEVLVCQADVSKYGGCERLVRESISKFGFIDVLVNNTDIEFNGSIMDTEIEKFGQVMKTNAYGPFYMSKLIVPYMLNEKSGSIIFISSTSTSTDALGSSAYASSKSTLLGLTKTLARDLTPIGVNVNAISPGAIETDMVSVLPEELKTWIKSGVYTARLEKPEEIGATTVFLASDKAKYLTGQNITINGIFRT